MTTMEGKASEAQEEFDNIFIRAAPGRTDRHPEDDEPEEQDEQDEEARHTQQKVESSMRIPVFDGPNGSDGGGLLLPDPRFDEGRTTGVKGVIADARSFETARKEGLLRGRTTGNENGLQVPGVYSTNGGYGGEVLSDGQLEDEDFLEKWRQARRMEMQREGSEIRNRRTSPSVRMFGRMDEVDALGYLDAIEKVGRETVVVVFVYDHECAVSQVIETALLPLASANPTIHFVKVHFEDIEFDNAGVPALLAYRNQGDLFANLTYVIDHIPEDTLFDTQALKDVLRKHEVL